MLSQSLARSIQSISKPGIRTWIDTIERMFETRRTLTGDNQLSFTIMMFRYINMHGTAYLKPGRPAHTRFANFLRNKAYATFCECQRMSSGNRLVRFVENETAHCMAIMTEFMAASKKN